LSLRYIVHGFESTGYMVSEVLGYRVHSFSLPGFTQDAGTFYVHFLKYPRRYRAGYTGGQQTIHVVQV